MTSGEFNDLTNYFQWFGSFLITVLAFAKTKGRQKQVLIIGIYGLNSVVFQSIQTGSNIFFGAINANLFGNLYVFTETVILHWLFTSAFNKTAATRIIIGVALIYAFIFLWFALPDLSVMQSNIRTIRDILMIVFALTYFFFLLRDLPEDNLYALPMFWINAGILFYFSCTFILSLSLPYLATALRDDFGYFWGFRNLLRGIFCLVICVGIWNSWALSKPAKISDL